MSIKNKDGTVYTIRGPNPLIVDQIEWDRSRVKLVNMNWKSEVVEDKRNPIEEMKKHSIDIGEELGLKENPKKKSKNIEPQKFIEEIIEQPKKVEVTPKKEEITNKEEVKNEELIINADSKLARIIKERGVEFFCAPVIDKKIEYDDFYGTQYESLVYGDQFIFDAIIIDSSDLQIQFWCAKFISKGSIIFKKNKQGGERWWRIYEITPKSEGWLVIANISEVNPDFS